MNSQTKSLREQRLQHDSCFVDCRRCPGPGINLEVPGWLDLRHPDDLVVRHVIGHTNQPAQLAELDVYADAGALEVWKGA
jgi:hypothetical protein